MELATSWGAALTKAGQLAYGRFRRHKPLDVQVRLGGIERTFFPDKVNTGEMSRRLAVAPVLDLSAWRRAVFADVGGVPQLGPVVISFSNPRRIPVAIIDMRSRILRRRTLTFADKYDPPIGGPINVAHISFDLDQNSSPGLLIDPNSPQGYTPRQNGGYSFFATQNLDIPVGGDPLQVIAWPQSVSGEVIDWVIDYTCTWKGWRNALIKRTSTLDLGKRPIVGVSPTAQAGHTIQFL